MTLFMRKLVIQSWLRNPWRVEKKHMNKTGDEFAIIIGENSLQSIPNWVKTISSENLLIFLAPFVSWGVVLLGSISYYGLTKHAIEACSIYWAICACGATFSMLINLLSSIMIKHFFNFDIDLRKPFSYFYSLAIDKHGCSSVLLLAPGFGKASLLVLGSTVLWGGVPIIFSWLATKSY